MREGDPLAPLALLVSAVYASTTTLTCILEMLSWEGYSSEEQTRLLSMYVPYLGVSKCIGPTYESIGQLTLRHSGSDGRRHVHTIKENIALEEQGAVVPEARHS